MSATTSSDAVTRQLARRRGEGRRALVVYLTAGYPTPSQSAQLLRDVAAAGADIVEVGVPFSDPMADGPVIQLASQVALGHGVGLRGTLEIVREAALPVPVVLFSYLNPLLAGGPGILEQATEAGVAGVLVTDLPVGVDPERERWFGESGLAFIRLVAPTTPDDRMREIGRHGSGFVYLISRLGVTGMQSDLSPELAPTIRRLRAATTLPLCAGFGISTPEQARAAGALADGIVVGSAIVSAAGRAPSEAVALTARLREALDSL
jgi:tryptophan synthase alpha chain